MKTILTLIAFLSVTFMGPLSANSEPVDCFYESNVGHPDCKK